MIIGNRDFDFENNKYIMGILNVTPDSFFDGSKYQSRKEAVNHAERMIAEGADIIDIGGESSRPGYVPVSTAEELDRVIPVIEAVRRISDIPISIDSMKSEVCEEAIVAGANLINDVWGLKRDENMTKIAIKYDVPVCIVHNRKGEYTNFFSDVLEDLRQSIKIAIDAGIDESRLILDPGIGFAKNTEENIKMMKNINILCELGFPVLLALSNKRMIGDMLDLDVDQRLEGTIAANVYGAIKGCSIFRVHDVKSHKRALDLVNGLLQD